MEAGMSAGTGIGKIWTMGKGAVKELVDQLGVTWEMILEDFVALRDSGRDKIGELLDEWAGDEKIRDLFEGFLTQADRGRESAVAYLKKKDAELQDYLEKQVRLTPHLVGGVDGFVQVYLAIPATRWTRSPRYRKGVKTGRVLGVLCAVTIFLPVSLGRAVIGLLPGATRFAKYFLKRWADAKKKRDHLKNEMD
jgi:hypothetical protein